MSISPFGLRSKRVLGINSAGRIIGRMEPDKDKVDKALLAMMFKFPATDKFPFAGTLYLPEGKQPPLAMLLSSLV